MGNIPLYSAERHCYCCQRTTQHIAAVENAGALVTRCSVCHRRVEEQRLPQRLSPYWRARLGRDFL